MPLLFSKYTQGALRVPAPQNAGEVVAVRYVHTLTAAQNVTGNILDLGILPAHARVVDMALDSDDLDTGTPAITIDVGIMSGLPGEALDEAGGARTCGAEFFDTATTGQAGGVARMTAKTGFRVAPTTKDRSIGLKVKLQSATAAEGEIGLTVFYGT